MPIITIQEKQNTRPNSTGVSSDIVFVPGFAINACSAQVDSHTELDALDLTLYTVGTRVYVVGERSVYALTSTDDAEVAVTSDVVEEGEDESGEEEAPVAPTVDKTWVKVAENVNRASSEPVLCASVREFEDNFGKTAYVFNITQTYINGTSRARTTNSVDIAAAGTCDMSYVYAKELLNMGMPVLYQAIPVSSVAEFYSKFNSVYQNLRDKGEYSIKYITSGGYPNFNVAGKNFYDDMLACATSRGDCVALLDPVNEKQAELTYTSTTSLYNQIYTYVNTTIKTDNSKDASYGAAFYPWGVYTCSMQNGAQYELPATFGYLSCLANATKAGPNWVAMAGAARGVVTNLNSLSLDNRLSNVIADTYQPTKGADRQNVAINAITNIKPYGLTIWGNRTLAEIDANGLTAENFLNTRNMISDIKKVAYTTAKSLMFEQNSDMLWLRFKAGVSPLLEKLKTGFGIADYKIIKLDTHYDGSLLGKEELAACIKIYPMYAIEAFEITIEVNDTDVSVQ